MDHQDEVTKWLAAAEALHAGALEGCASGVCFSFTEEAISYLCSFRTGTGDSLQNNNNECSLAAARRNYVYHPDKIIWTVGGLSVFFRNRQSSPCVLCEGARIHSDNTTSHYKLSVTNDYDRHEPGTATLDPQRLEHLATLHTPYFVMLFVGLVKKKRYKFHRGVPATNIMARHLILTPLGGASGPAHSRDENLRSDMAVLKLWWRYQDRQSSSRVNIHTIILHSER